MISRSLFLSLALFSSTLYAGNKDLWNNFRPETATNFGCDIDQTIVTRSGSGASEEQWITSAWAKHFDSEDPKARDWEFTLAYEPATNRGFKAAMKECQDWQIEARKRINAAQKISNKKGPAEGRTH